jgi:hypothetical protein
VQLEKGKLRTAEIEAEAWKAKVLLDQEKKTNLKLTSKLW